MSSKLLKAKEQMKNQVEDKDSVLGAIKKYKAEEQTKPSDKKRNIKRNLKIRYVGVALGLHRFSFFVMLTDMN